ncbi:MAG: hypothetical protein ACOYYU_09390 [Chloroflexota bacterium]
MKDDFLYQSRPPLRKEFADNLYRQLSNKYPDVNTSRKGAFIIMNRQWAWKFALTASLIIISLALVMPFDVRAQVIRWVKSVAGFQVEERSESPITDSGEAQATSLVPAYDTTPLYVTPTVVNYPTINPQALFANAPFKFGLPQYIPEGFTLDENAAIATSDSWVSLTWSSQNAEIMMLVEKQYLGYPLPTGMNGAEEIQVNGKPALLIRGWWDENHKWDPTRGFELHWMIQDIHYRLIYSQRSVPRWEIEPISGDADKILKDLISMAESVP